MRYRASFLAYAFWVHKNATPKNWLMRVKGLTVKAFYLLYITNKTDSYILVVLGNILSSAYSRCE